GSRDQGLRGIRPHPRPARGRRHPRRGRQAHDHLEHPMTKPQRAPRKKGPSKGTGGLGRRALEGKGPTPKAEDRSWHPAGKRKASRERFEAASSKGRPQQQQPPRHRKPSSAKDDSEM